MGRACVGSGQARATRASFPHLSPPSKREALVLRHRYDARQMTLIRRGFVPQGSDDRWFAWFEDQPGGGTLHLIRSWTGSQIYALDFTDGPVDGAMLTGGWVSRDSAVYVGDTAAEEAQAALELLTILLLDRP